MKYGSLISLMVLLSFSSCIKQKSNYKTVGIDGNIVIKPSEELTGRTLRLYCTTEQKFACPDCKINASVEKNGSKIVISFKNIIVPTNCSDQNASYHAFSEIHVGALGNGTYSVTINSGKKQSMGTLTVTEESYAFAFNSTDGFNFSNDPLLRIPINTIWGTVNSFDTLTAAVADSFLDSLEYFGAKPFTGMPGYYGTFELDSSHNIMNTNYSPVHTRSFIYLYTGDWANIMPLMQRFVAKYNQTMYHVSVGTGTYYEWPQAVYAL